MRDIAVTLASVTDWAGFSHAVRALRSRGVDPSQVRWHVDGADERTADLFDTLPACRARDLLPAAPMALPRAFVAAAQEVFLHSDAQRLPLIHRLALRIADDGRAWDDPLHEDRLQFDRMLREVRREIHKMHAFVRFRPIESAGAPLDDPIAHAAVASDRAALAADVRHVAWFEPGHQVLEAAAPFFARRFATMRWAILTPRASVQWDGRNLAFGPGARRAEAPSADAGEALWLAYYGSIFNPARVKVSMMKKEMPVRFWKNLPEAAAIPELLAQASRREQGMVAAVDPARSRRRGQVATALDAPAAPAAPVTLALLAARARQCRDCPGADAATQTVFGQGGAQARVMLVGEQPGDQEDLQGLPFQGPAGQLLRAAFAQLGWPPEALYLTNAVKHFHHELRGKRRIHKTPGQQEAAACLHWLEAEIDVVRPRAIVALGATAARSLLGASLSVTAHDGQWLQRADRLPVLVCLHPAAILRADPARQAALHQRWLAALDQATPHVLGAANDLGAELAA